MTLKRDPKLKLTFCLKNDMGNFNPSSGKSENLPFDGMRLSEVSNV